MTVKKFFPILALAILLVSCSKQEQIPASLEQDAYFVTEEQLKTILSNSYKLIGDVETDAISPRSGIELIDYFTVKDSIDRNVMYIANYTEESEHKFIIIAADTRLESILAFGSNVFKYDSIPQGLGDWIEQRMGQITEIREESASIETFSNQWDALIIEEDLPCYGGGSVQVGPLSATTWNQGCGHNTFCPTCTNGGSCDRCPTGCVATAMAQVMRYWSFPASHAGNTYTWATMPNNTGSTNIARLMRDIGDEVDMDYECDGSGADYKDIDNAFEDFGYSTSAKAVDFSGSKLRQELDLGRLVILRGGEKSGGIFPHYTNGHAWVCDGYWYTYYANCPGSLYHYRMNWGWGGTFNGWYATGDFSPGSNTFNYKNKMIVEIKPQIQRLKTCQEILHFLACFLKINKNETSMTENFRHIRR